MLSLQLLLLMKMWVKEVTFTLVVGFCDCKCCLMNLPVDLFSDQSMKHKHPFSSRTMSVDDGVVIKLKNSRTQND